MTFNQDIPLDPLIEEITKILNFIQEEEIRKKAAIEAVHPDNKESARNLIHYMALRSFDLRKLQEQLSALSISSLAHSEGYTLSNVQNILQWLHLLKGEEPARDLLSLKAPFTYREHKGQQRMNAEVLFGASSAGGNKTRIMVTMPEEAAYDYEMIRKMLLAGMDVARLNTSHDSPEAWERMIDNIRRAEAEEGKPCKVYFDLSGPKLRTDFTDAILFRKEKPKKKKKKNKPGVRLFREEQIIIARKPSKVKKVGEEIIAIIGTTLPEMFSDVKIGQVIYFDDGKIGGKIVSVKEDQFTVEITQAAMEGTKLRPEKGINLPDTHLNLKSLTGNDYENLQFLAKYADTVGYSFVRTPEDVRELQTELARLGRPDMGIILKIENREAFENLPELLLTAMRSPQAGVMIARGDLAVEIGFERTAEVQEEIMWICEAGQIPDIWATQVLESLAKKGLATRGEITDAAMASRASCVMLNKGPYIVNAVQTLKDVISRMEQHLDRKHGSLRPLSVAKRFSIGESRLIEA